MSPADGPKVALIGIDAGDMGLIRSHLDELPHLRALFAEGQTFELDASANVLTSAAWPTFSTGKPPGEHGLYYPMQWDPERMTLRRVAAGWLPFEPFWHELVREGKRVTVLDAPFSLPSRLDGGVEVVDWGAQERLGDFHCNRPDLAREIERRFGRHPVGEDVPVEEPPARLERLGADLVTGARRKAELSRWLMETTEWDLFLTVFAECHRAGHVLWPAAERGETRDSMRALLEVYRAVDEGVGHVRGGIDPATTTLAVFSVHGMQANNTQEHFLLPVMERINALYRGEAAPAEAPPKESFNPIRALRAAVPPGLQAMAARTLPNAVRDWVVRRTHCGGLDWSATPGFAVLTSGDGYLRYNLAGRETEGSLEPNSADFERYERLLEDCLLGLEDTATGERIVEDVVSGDSFAGSRRRYLPDVVVRWKDSRPATEIRSERLGRFRARLATGRTGEHRPGGFAVVVGDESGIAPIDGITDFAAFSRSALARQHAL